ncbi:MAG: hypothetical protein ACK5UC_02200, partial [Planctomycetaceae bacterium]
IRAEFERFCGVHKSIDETDSSDPHVSEPLQGSSTIWMSPTQGSRGAANPGLSKSSPSGNDTAQCRCAVDRLISPRWMSSQFLNQMGNRTTAINSVFGP